MEAHSTAKPGSQTTSDYEPLLSDGALPGSASSSSRIVQGVSGSGGWRFSSQMEEEEEDVSVASPSHARPWNEERVGLKRTSASEGKSRGELIHPWKNAHRAGSSSRGTWGGTLTATSEIWEREGRGAGNQDAGNQDFGDSPEADIMLVSEMGTSSVCSPTRDISGAGGDGVPLLKMRSWSASADFNSQPNSPQNICRICLEGEGDDLITPCRCSGTQRYVHRSCLDSWRSVKEGFAFAHCTECRAQFHLELNVPPDRWWRRIQFQFFVTRDIALIFLSVQLVVALVGWLVYLFYGDELYRMFGYALQSYAFYTLGVLFFMTVGLLYGFFIAIIMRERISDRHYHILQRAALTHEYIVQDRGDNAHQSPPSLPSSHISELQSLGLL